MVRFPTFQSLLCCYRWLTNGLNVILVSLGTYQYITDDSHGLFASKS